MRKDYAIRLQNVSKIYKLHGSQRDQLVDILGLKRIGFKAKTATKEFVALNNISLDVPRGHKIGIVGRNGAGKTTLLKLLCGNFVCSSGTVEVNGEVQALMNVGLGFHPEYTGRENVEASLQYSGLIKNDYQQAIDGIIEFCELAEFYDQPFKTYSLGMQARLMFAAATAIRPDILIVDEVLGAGDAYFVAKSKNRVEQLVNSGCTMLLVSHSMSQVLELCDEAIWLHEGQIHMRGSAFEVVKAYESFLHGPRDSIKGCAQIETTISTQGEIKHTNEPVLKGQKKQLFTTNNSHSYSMLKDRSDPVLFQEPLFIPHGSRLALTHIDRDELGFKFIATGGISRWGDSARRELEFTGFSIVSEAGETNILSSLGFVNFVFSVRSVTNKEYLCRYAVTINDHNGNVLCRIRSPLDRFYSTANVDHRVEMALNPIQLGSGEYLISLAVFEYGSLELVNNTKRYDLLSRSFMFKVENPSSWSSVENHFFHSAEWNFGTVLPTR